MIGKSIPRLESGDKVSGKLTYLGDLKIPGMLHGKILRSTCAHGKILRVDASRAEKLPGVMAVITRNDLIGNTRYESHYGPVLLDQTIVAIDKVRYVGDPVAGIAATRADIAEEALDLIDVDYEELPAVTDPEEALAQTAPILHEHVKRPGAGFVDLHDVDPVAGTNICNHFHLQKGDIERGFAESDYVFEDLFTTPATQHCALESFTCVASFERNGKLTIWDTVQNPFVIRDAIAELFHLPLSKVRVISLYLGGGYGSKLYPKLEPLVVALADKAKKPVGITLTREEVFQTITKHAAKIYLKTGVKRDGTIQARHVRVFLDTGSYAEIGPRVCKKSGFTAAGPYLIPNLKIDSYLAYTNRTPAGAFRGFGVSQSAWAHESQMDMIARTLKIDPVELRRKNILDQGGEFSTGEHVKSVAMRECLDKVAEAIEWGKKSISPDPTKARGKGMAFLIKATITPSVSSALMRLNEDGSVHAYVGTVEIGQGSDTLMAQIAAEEMCIPIERVFVVHSDTDLTPYDLTTSSSRSTFHVGRALQMAGQDIKRQLVQMAQSIFKTSSEDFVFENGTMRPQGSDVSTALTYSNVLSSFYRIKGANLIGQGYVKTNAIDEQTGEHNTSAFWFAGAGAAEVEVDRDTGMVRVLRYATSADVGKAINPLGCRQQLEGAAITGIGQALLEQMVYQDGLLINPNFMDYNLPRFPDIPEKIIAILVENPHPDGPFGAKGVGETGLIPVAPAIANAIEDAVGVRIKDLPITSEAVFMAMQKQQSAVEEVAAVSTRTT